MEKKIEIKVKVEKRVENFYRRAAKAQSILMEAKVEIKVKVELFVFLTLTLALTFN